MDDPEEEEEEEEGATTMKSCWRLALLFVSPIVVLFLSSLTVGFLPILGGEVSIPTPTSPVPSQCRILSSSVDIRSSEVCEAGAFNYGAKKVLHPFQRSKFRCRYEYYWASVFQVEYRDHSLGQMKLALSEAPNEALPIDCRPSFGAAWLTKDRFRVNETYNCWYTSGMTKVMLYRDGFFHCQAEGPSRLEMIGDFLTMYAKNLQYLFVRKKGSSIYWKLETIVGVITGFLTAFFTVIFIRILQLLGSRFLHTTQTCITRMLTSGRILVFLKRACFLVAYCSIMGWLAVQYGKKLGLLEMYKMINY